MTSISNQITTMVEQLHEPEQILILEIVKRFLPVDISEQRRNHAEQILELIKRKNIPNITLPPDEKGNAFIDKERYPDLYDWAVNG
jgi:hypothetical protein